MGLVTLLVVPPGAVLSMMLFVVARSWLFLIFIFLFMVMSPIFAVLPPVVFISTEASVLFLFLVRLVTRIRLGAVSLVGWRLGTIGVWRGFRHVLIFTIWWWLWHIFIVAVRRRLRHVIVLAVGRRLGHVFIFIVWRRLGSRVVIRLEWVFLHHILEPCIVIFKCIKSPP